MLYRAAKLLNRPFNRLGDHLYAIQGTGYDAHGQRNTWHINMAETPPHCDCPNWERPPYPEYCKHIILFRFIEGLMVEVPPHHG